MTHRRAATRRAVVLDEGAAIATLARALTASSPSPEQLGVRVGIGDDAAVIDVGGRRLVCSVDSSIEGRHFDLAWLSIGAAAARATTAALSDLGAMGAKPLAALCALQLPRRVTRSDLRGIGTAQSKVCAQHGCLMIGGNIVGGDCFGFTTTVLGTARRPLLRSGARPGDELWLVGAVGMAGLGLKILQRGGARTVHERACVRAWRQPRALVEQGLLLRGRATALIDVSDGLASEARHLSKSSDARIEIDEVLLRAVCPRALVRAAHDAQLDPISLMLNGGEDYALLGSGPAAKRPPFAAHIGYVRAGRGAWLRSPSGVRRLEGGFDHLTAAP